MVSKKMKRMFMLVCIELYQTLPALWKVQSKEYSKRILKNQQYNIVLTKYREKYSDADRKKLNSILRTKFRKKLKLIKDSKKSGAGVDDVVEPMLWYFEKMMFLHDQKAPPTLKNTMSSQNEDKIEVENAKRSNMSVIGKRNMRIIGRIDYSKKLKQEDDSKQLITLVCKPLQQPDAEYHKIAAT
ncbi:hypothetical protein RN001_007993 [Aquatica leii]|uniref:MADF domain-containing protein n=1 Tax=Aquatica leii TaxID=1421715 RepID=A0AAN7PYQ6_9COLE|nr:hypothetical protein RN001_007993 [Aquatica leii]